MSETMESTGFAQNSITRARPHLLPTDNATLGAYDAYNRFSTINQPISDYPSLGQYDIQPSYGTFQSTNAVNGQQQLQQFHQSLHHHAGQEIVQRSELYVEDGLDGVNDYELSYPHFGQYTVPNAASSVPNYYRQTGTPWGNELNHETNLNQRNLFNEYDPMPIVHQSQATITPTGPVYRNEPYAKLIFMALRSAPGNKMILKDIYKWFEKFTDKAQTGSKGWQNSIRHNLSMNIAFQKEEAVGDLVEGKRTYTWALSKEALQNGFVESTTRFRKPLKAKGTSRPQPSYRVSKASTSVTTPPTRSPYYQLPPYHQIWENTGGAEQEYGFKELQASPPPTPVWSSQMPCGLLQAHYKPPPFMPIPDQRFTLKSAGDYEAATAGVPGLIGARITAPFQQPSVDKHNGDSRLFELAEEAQISPAPSMTTASSTFGYHEMAEERRHEFDQFYDLNVSNPLSDQQGPRLSSTKPHSIDYEEHGHTFIGHL